jgi:hypothetical protein
MLCVCSTECVAGLLCGLVGFLTLPTIFPNKCGSLCGSLAERLLPIMSFEQGGFPLISEIRETCGNDCTSMGLDQVQLR